MQKYTLLNKILRLNLGAIEKSILYAICLDSDSHGVSWRRRTNLARMAGVSESTLKRKLALLRKIGIVKTERTPGASKNSLNTEQINNCVKEQEYGGASLTPSMVPLKHHQSENDGMSADEWYCKQVDQDATKYLEDG